MMSIPAVSMSRTAACTASSNISSRSAGPNSPRSYALTPANHQPGFPWEPTTAVGMRGSVMVSGLQRAGSRRAPDDTCETWISPGILEPAREEDRAALDHVETAAVLRRPADAELRDLVRPAAVDGLAAELDPARARAQVPHDRAQGRRLPRAVPADEADHLARAHAERHGPQDVARLDEHVDGVHGQHGPALTAPGRAGR